MLIVAMHLLNVVLHMLCFYVAIYFTSACLSTYYSYKVHVMVVLATLLGGLNPTAVLRMKLSKRLNACVLDRPCSQSGCGHRHKSQEWWVVALNSVFLLLNLLHLAYLGVMFDAMNEEPGLQEQVCLAVSLF